MVKIIVFAIATLQMAAQAPPADPWEPLKSLTGSWTGVAEGQPGTGASTRQYKFVLNGKYLEGRNKSVYPPQAKNPKGETHEDWSMISFDRQRKRLILRQFHGEGFVNQFVAESPAAGPIRFVSESIENIPAGYRARETYTFSGPDAFVEVFELAEPGKDFEVYSMTRFTRAK